MDANTPAYDIIKSSKPWENVAKSANLFHLRVEINTNHMPLDIISVQDEALSYRQKFNLWPTRWENCAVPISLNWKAVKFEKENKATIPENQGVYAFFVEPQVADLPNHAYLMYIGETGQDGDNNLRERFSDYLSYKKNSKRLHIHRFLNKWDGYLYFYYAEISQSAVNLRDLETMLLDTFVPPYNRKDFSPEIGRIFRGLS